MPKKPRRHAPGKQPTDGTRMTIPRVCIWYLVFAIYVLSRSWALSLVWRIGTDTGCAGLNNVLLALCRRVEKTQTATIIRVLLKAWNMWFKWQRRDGCYGHVSHTDIHTKKRYISTQTEQKKRKNEKTEVVQKKWRKQRKAGKIQQVIDGGGVQLGTRERPRRCQPSALRKRIEAPRMLTQILADIIRTERSYIYY